MESILPFESALANNYNSIVYKQLFTTPSSIFHSTMDMLDSGQERQIKFHSMFELKEVFR